MKKTLALLLILTLTLSCASFSFAEEREATLDNGMTYATGFPITKEPITLKVLAKDGGTLRPSLDTTEVIKYIAEKTNITLDIELFTEADTVAMMYVSGDYPDFGMAIGSTNQQLVDAAAAGEVVALDPLIDQVCPNWRAFRDQYKLAYNSCKSADGNMYVLPFCNFAPFDRDLRDMFMVNTKWCEELGVKVPETISEFTTFLRAVRDNAGKGSIPEMVEPLNLYKDGKVGGYIDFFNFFGIPVTDTEFLVVNDGKVAYQAVNEKSKEVLKYLQSLYNEGLILPESFTDDWNMHLAKIQSKGVPTIGAYFAYDNENLDYFSPISPLDAENGTRPTIRRQTYTAGVKGFVLYSNNQYPYATMRLMDALIDYSDPAFCETVTMGLEGKIWNYNEDGKIVEGYIDDEGKYVMFKNEDPDWAEHYGFWNSFIGVRTPEWYSEHYFEMQSVVENSRAWAFEKFYKDWIYDASMSYMGAALDEEDNQRLVELQAEIKNYRQATYTAWICGKADIDAEWDGFVKHMNELHVDEWLELKQKAYDLLNAQ